MLNGVINQEVNNLYALYQGDCIELIRNIPDNSVHYSMFSPPFFSLYSFSNSERDMSNCENKDEFLEHFRFLVKELYRVLVPGRLVTIHCMETPCTIHTDGFIGLRDFPGDIIRLFESEGFYFHSRCLIWKDPLIQATRTHVFGLLHKTLVSNASMCRQGLGDTLITMRKPGDSDEIVTHEDGLTEYYGTDKIDDTKVFSHQVWRKYASPIWMDIRQTHTLNSKDAIDEKDERHIAPLQLDVVNRCIDLWTNKGEIVLDPFAGIGTVPYCAVKLDRRGLGFELKDSYFKQALKNMKRAEREAKEKANQLNMIDMLGEVN